MTQVIFLDPARLPWLQQRPRITPRGSASIILPLKYSRIIWTHYIQFVKYPFVQFSISSVRNWSNTQTVQFAISPIRNWPNFEPSISSKPLDNNYSATRFFLGLSGLLDILQTGYFTNAATAIKPIFCFSEK